MSDESIFLQAWNEIIEDSEVVQECYLSLYENVSYYGGPEGFGKVLDYLEDACQGVLELVRKRVTQYQAA